MRTDPREACANTTEDVFWAIVHDVVAHPLMALSGWSQWSLRLHNYTSDRAWPRDKSVNTKKGEVLMVLRSDLFWGTFKMWHMSPDIFGCIHPNIPSCQFRVNADGWEAAERKFIELFEELAVRHGPLAQKFLPKRRSL